jgi:magnesium transporter
MPQEANKTSKVRTGHVFTEEQINSLTENVKQNNFIFVHELLDKYHPADVADLIKTLPNEVQIKLFSHKSADLNPEVVLGLSDILQKEILEQLSPDIISSIIKQLESDDAFQIIENVPEEFQNQILNNLPQKDQNFFRLGLKYPKDSAARIMQREFVTIDLDWTVGQTMDFLRDSTDLPEQFLEIFVVDKEGKPIGNASILRSDPNIKVKNLVAENKTFIPADLDKERVGNIFTQYNLVSAGVVDQEQKLIGVITGDDVVTIVKEEAVEDALRLGGIGAAEDISDNPIETTKNRFLWLLINLLTAVLASYVIGIFENTIQKVIALAVLMPIVASMGGNAATQTLTVTIQLIASQQLNAKNVMKIINREVVTGLLNGLVFAAITGVFVYFWFHDLKIAILIGAAMIVNLTVAGLAGIAIPVTLNKMKIDPAVSATVFVTTVTDVVGFFAFLGIASLFV